MPAKKVPANRGSNPQIVLEDVNDAVEVLRFYKGYLKADPVDPHDHRQVQERIEKYFDDCCRDVRLPTVEGMSAACGVTRETLWKWSTGQGSTTRTAEVIRRAKTALSSVDAELALKQKISPICWIFRAKNFYNMSDKIEIAAPANTFDPDTLSREELMQRYDPANYGMDDQEK